MFTTQYKINLPNDYDMNIIRDRIKNNGFKTDGFDELKYKFYLISEKEINTNISNSYAPLYLWKNNLGLNKFLFEGFYDNILSSFGWQKVRIGIPLLNTISSAISDYNHIFEYSGNIPPQTSLKNITAQFQKEIPPLPDTEMLLIYNSESWEYSAFYFTNDLTAVTGIPGTTYSILHVSSDNN